MCRSKRYHSPGLDLTLTVCGLMKANLLVLEQVTVHGRLLRLPPAETEVTTLWDNYSTMGITN